MPRCVTLPPRTTWSTQRLRSPVISNQSPSTAREAPMIERYEELVRENKRLRAQLASFRHSHYQTQAALARSAIAGEIKHGPGGDRADRRRHAGGQPMTTNMMGRTLWIWLAITLFTACLFGLLDLIFKTSTPM